MILIKPIAITDDNLTSSIPNPDASMGEIEWTSGTYTLGTMRTEGDSIYEVVADPSTSDQPSVGAAKTPATWVFISPVNKAKMFDQANNTQSVADNLTVSVAPTQLTNAVAGFNIDCTSITVKVFDLADNEVYSNDVAMRQRPLVNGWYNYYYSGFEVTNKFVLTDIPPTTQGRIQAEFFGDQASVGTMIIGKQVSVGDAQYGTGAQLLDFSSPVEDQYGNITYTQGFIAKLVDFEILADTASIDPIFTEFENLGKTPAVFVGNPSSIGDSTLVYGYVRDFNPVYTWPTKSKISLTVRGLV